MFGHKKVKSPEDKASLEEVKAPAVSPGDVHAFHDMNWFLHRVGKRIRVVDTGSLAVEMDSVWVPENSPDASWFFDRQYAGVRFVDAKPESI